MSNWSNAAVTVAAICAIIAGFVAVIPLFRIGMELQRAREAGEIDIQSPARGLPLEVVFTPNILPRVEKDRQRLVKGLLAFLVCGLVGFGIAVISDLLR